MKQFVVLWAAVLVLLVVSYTLKLDAGRVVLGICAGSIGGVAASLTMLAWLERRT